MVCDTALLLNEAIRAGKTVLFEGAQGTMLDIDHGTYPFVTSSSASAGGACTGTGVPPTRIDGVIGVSKAYITRVGGGPFPTEALDGAGEQIRKRGNEFGAVTGRPRRCGWFDAAPAALHRGHQRVRQPRGDQARRARRVRPDPGVRGLPAGRAGSRRICRPRWREIASSNRCTNACPAGKPPPSGFRRTTNCRRPRARTISRFWRSRTGVEVGCISTGPERNQTIVRAGSRFASFAHVAPPAGPTRGASIALAGGVRSPPACSTVRPGSRVHRSPRGAARPARSGASVRRITGSAPGGNPWSITASRATWVKSSLPEAACAATPTTCTMSSPRIRRFFRSAGPV